MARRRMAQFADIYLKHLLQQRQTTHAGEIQQANQSALAKLQAMLQSDQSKQRAEEALLPKVQDDPGFAYGLIKSGRSSLAGQDITNFGEDSFGPELKQITAADQLSKLPTPGALVNQRIARRGAPMRSLDEVRQMVEANQAQEAALRARMDPTKIEDVDPTTGLKRTQFVSSDPAQLTGQSFTTEPTPEQAGLNAGEQERAKITAPGLQTAQIGSKLREINELGPAQARQAGQVAGAQESARTAAEIRTKSRLLPLLTEIEREVAQARAAGRPTNGATSQLVGSFAQRMVIIATALNTEQSRFQARSGGVRQSIAQVTGLPVADDSPLLGADGKAIMNNDGTPMTKIQGASELESLSSGLTSTMLRALGRVGPPTENDEKRTRALFPALGLQPAENSNRNANFLKLVQAAERVGQRRGLIDPSLPPEAQEAEVAQRLQEALTEAGQGGALRADEILNLPPN